MNPEIDISNVILKTERLLIRPWRQSDIDDFYSYASVDGVGQMAGCFIMHYRLRIKKKKPGKNFQVIK